MRTILQREQTRRIQQMTRTHGEAHKTVEWVCWWNMRARCKYRVSNSYEYYGGRGISVCKRWEKYQNFLEDMGRKPGLEYSIDRIDNNGNYEPENCRWALDSTQNKNRRKWRKTI